MTYISVFWEILKFFKNTTVDFNSSDVSASHFRQTHSKRDDDDVVCVVSDDGEPG